MQEPEYSFEFEIRGEPFHVNVWHFAQLSIKERTDFSISENSYLALVRGNQQLKPFELFISEDLEWHTKSTFVVSQEIVDRIGLEIERRSA